MDRTHYITITEFCSHYQAEYDFVRQLHQSGLIELIVAEEEELLIPMEQLTNLEKFTRLHYELDINTEGIETISYLLQRMAQMQTELNELRARLRLYEHSA